MKKSLKTLRPVGNPIKHHKNPVDYTQFGDFYVDFYQPNSLFIIFYVIQRPQHIIVKQGDDFISEKIAVSKPHFKRVPPDRKNAFSLKCF